MFYSTDCNFVIKVIGKEQTIECYTKEQVKNNIRHASGCIVYKTSKVEAEKALKSKRKGYWSDRKRECAEKTIDIFNKITA